MMNNGQAYLLHGLPLPLKDSTNIQALSENMQRTVLSNYLRDKSQLTEVKLYENNRKTS